jgi:hypothetical protein
MKKGLVKLILSLILMMVVSCDEPETVVTDFVHADGSVTRKIEMRNLENKFNPSHLQVPFDSTWIVKDSIELSEKGDTAWIKRAQKLFKNVDEINLAYISGLILSSGLLKKLIRVWFMDTLYQNS